MTVITKNILLRKLCSTSLTFRLTSQLTQNMTNGLISSVKILSSDVGEAGRSPETAD